MFLTIFRNLIKFKKFDQHKLTATIFLGAREYSASSIRLFRREVLRAGRLVVSKKIFQSVYQQWALSSIYDTLHA